MALDDPQNSDQFRSANDWFENFKGVLGNNLPQRVDQLNDLASRRVKGT